MNYQGWNALPLLALAVLVGSCGDPIVAPQTDGSMQPQDASAVRMCSSDAQCDDGIFCNGVERCEEGRCAPGETPDCDDATECTIDRCDEPAGRCVHEAPDADGDGAPDAACGGNDCDDADPLRTPGAIEVCDPDDRDEDCDPTTFGFRDSDRDGWPDAACCNVLSDGARACGTDCDDTLPTAHPSEAEVCDGVDNDCDGDVDEGTLFTFFLDDDRDGFGDAAGTTIEACFAPDGYADDDDDCDDTRGFVSPSAPEVCDGEALDEDCDGVSNPEDLCNCAAPDSRSCAALGVCASGTQDCAGGMWGACSIAGSAEVCNGLDDDCDGSVDEGLLVRCFEDADGDTFPVVAAALAELCPDAARPFVSGCPVGYTNREPLGALSLDCEGADPGRFPGAVETCDAIDQDCDGAIDEGLRITCYDDGDGDGYALGAATARDLCPPPGMSTCPMGTTSRAPMGVGTSDCDDANAARSPSAIETCNGVDDDCDGVIDDALRVACYTDADGDGYAVSGATATQSCPDPSTGACPAGRTSRAPMGAGTIDCDDGAATRAPSVAEVCNAIDDDCDGMVDELLRLTCYTDADHDGYPPSGATGSTVCPAAGGGCPTGLTPRAPGMGPIDCADGTATRSPAIAETCNGIDDDCDMHVDEGLLLTCYTDMDSDGYPPSGAPAMALCPAGGGACPSMTTSRSPAAGAIDCADTTAARSPAVAEACNGIDDDCDTRIDEGVATRCYVDADRDGFALAGAASTEVCGTCPVGRTPVAPGPGAIDCDDTTAGRSPVVPEICNSIDDDCDGVPDDGITLVPRYVDADNDGFGAGPVQMVCPGAGGYADTDGDCRDDAFAVHPGQAGWFFVPACPPGEVACSSSDGMGCRPSAGGSCTFSAAFWDYDCSRRLETDVPPGSCADLGATCAPLAGCEGTAGYLPEASRSPCGRANGTRTCSCEFELGMGSRCVLRDVASGGFPGGPGGGGVEVRCH